MSIISCTKPVSVLLYHAQNQFLFPSSLMVMSLE